VNLGKEIAAQDLELVLERIIDEVRSVVPRVVVVDSVRTVVRVAREGTPGSMSLADFAATLAQHLAGWQTNAFLVGEYDPANGQDNPVLTVADGVLWLYQCAERNSVVRKMQVVKSRGCAHMPGMHTFRITRDGVVVFPRIPSPSNGDNKPLSKERLSTGIVGLDDMTSGGFVPGDAVLVAGPSGSGKTILGTQFIARGGELDQPGVIVAFEEHPEQYLARAQALGFDLGGMIARGKLEVVFLRPLDLSVDETVLEVQSAVKRVGAQRLVIDSLSGFELALAPTFREGFRESLYRMVGSLTMSGVTVVMTVEVVDAYTELRFSPHAVSFLADDIILQRYVEIRGELRKVMTVVKMRGSAHSTEVREYAIGSGGVVVGACLSDYQGLLTGVASPLIGAQGVRGNGPAAGLGAGMGTVESAE
jgi:circadian clock protein KaiC